MRAQGETMKISRLECLHADAGCRNFDYLKITTDDGLTGWSEFNESFGGMGVSSVIEHLAPTLLGRDPRAYEAIVAMLYAVRRQASGGLVQQALGAVENALLDLKAKALGISVSEMLGGPVRDRIRLYWSHCGTYRVNWPEAHDYEPVESTDDVKSLGREVKAKKFTALKTNIFLFDRQPAGYMPGFNRPLGYPELNAERDVIDGLKAQLEAFREGSGPDMDILLDLNFNFKTEGYLRIVEMLAPLGLFWIEIDSYSPQALALIRQRSTTPISSCETLLGIREFRPYFEHQSMDVAIIDGVWNGVWQSMKIAALAEAHEVNVAPHNFYGHLSSMMSAHFSAAVPNFRIMEIDIDEVTWRDELFTAAPKIEDGYLILPKAPGWGTDPNEEALRAHPPRSLGGIIAPQAW
jgi:L-alanine-DL-glutamate epimerase-like enolase superfamily enzyme